MNKMDLNKLIEDLDVVNKSMEPGTVLTFNMSFYYRIILSKAVNELKNQQVAEIS